MGDILHALPAVTALRIEHPSWRIDWVVEPKWSALLAARNASGRDSGEPHPRQPVVDKLHLAPAKEWGRSPFSAQTRAEVLQLRRALRRGQYDTAIDFQGAVRSAAFARLAGCRLIGESAPRENVARWLFTERVATRGAHVIEQDFELAAAVAGDELRPVRPWLPFDAEAETWAEAVLAASTGKPPVLINPGAGWGAKRWPVERYAAVARGLIERGCRVLVNAGPGEEPIAEMMMRETAGAATPLAPSLENLIALTRRIALVIAGDTGPLHLASALEKPVVGIYGPTDPSRNGPFGTRCKVLRNPSSRRDHSRRKDPEAGLLTIEPEEVLEAADELLHAGAAL
jgi:lipopolysaccharide heptosyltransferase I